MPAKSIGELTRRRLEGEIPDAIERYGLQVHWAGESQPSTELEQAGGQARNAVTCNLHSSCCVVLHIADAVDVGGRWGF